MHHAVECYFDETADAQVRAIWSRLDAEGVTSLGGVPDTFYRPHVSLAVFETNRPDLAGSKLAPVLGPAIGLPLALGPLGFFLTEEAVAFLGVVPTRRFLDIHHRTVKHVKPLVEHFWPYYDVDNLVGHCTLAVGVHDHSRVAEIVAETTLPIPATVQSIDIVELPSGRYAMSVAGAHNRT